MYRYLILSTIHCHFFNFPIFIVLSIMKFIICLYFFILFFAFIKFIIYSTKNIIMPQILSHKFEQQHKNAEVTDRNIYENIFHKCNHIF